MIKLVGTKFQLKVWNYLKRIPKGKTKTYKEIAIAIKKPLSYRAVANAVAKNPIHRSFLVTGSLDQMVLWVAILEKVVYLRRNYYSKKKV